MSSPTASMTSTTPPTGNTVQQQQRVAPEECITCRIIGTGALAGVGFYALQMSRPKAPGASTLKCPFAKGLRSGLKSTQTTTITPTKPSGRRSLINMTISHSPYLRIAASAVATIFIGFGFNAILRPENALTFFEWEPPTSASAKTLVDNLILLYGVRDIFMGVVINIAAYFGDRKALGWILIASSGVAFADGVICWNQGKGEWNHWSYAPMLVGLGSLLLGTLDRV
ncbi:hypothetical protein BJ322DRAFT_1213340 [Thelephora terrestris]|uniref:Distal membrane-arm assembly complex protein 1-like domain-containing protein n=1 Tax=Thelephora terrestris TaxID=56493 RepID=A0A9P6H9X8_9AGAM|nr:hypothetical protein BJ322DRAFT_1213340 [Thelephora terrestris]